MTDISTAYAEGLLTGVGLCVVVALVVLLISMLFGGDE